MGHELADRRERGAAVSIAVSEGTRRETVQWRAEELFGSVLVDQELFDFGSQRVIVAADVGEKRLALTSFAFESRKSQSFARRQSRFTVSFDTCSTSAVSSTLNPPKNRSSITRLLRRSTCAKASKRRP